MAALAGEQAWKTDTLVCQVCNEMVKVRKGQSIPSCPNGHTTFDERWGESRGERAMRANPRTRASARRTSGSRRTGRRAAATRTGRGGATKRGGMRKTGRRSAPRRSAARSTARGSSRSRKTSRRSR
jgi:hypothetical protein